MFHCNKNHDIPCNFKRLRSFLSQINSPYTQTQDKFKSFTSSIKLHSSKKWPINNIKLSSILFSFMEIRQTYISRIYARCTEHVYAHTYTNSVRARDLDRSNSPLIGRHFRRAPFYAPGLSQRAYILRSGHKLRRLPRPLSYAPPRSRFGSLIIGSV